MFKINHIFGKSYVSNHKKNEMFLWSKYSRSDPNSPPGVLLVNVTWRGKSYAGMLLDCTQHGWAPPRWDLNFFLVSYSFMTYYAGLNYLLSFCTFWMLMHLFIRPQPVSPERSVLCQGRITLSLRVQKLCPISGFPLSDSHQNWQVASSIIQ